MERDGHDGSPRSSTSPRRSDGHLKDGDQDRVAPSARSASAPRSPGPTHYNPITAVPATFTFTGDLAVELGKSLAEIPTKVGALVHSIGGGERDPETPISVVGASIIGGDTVDHGLWVAFWFFLAQLNFVLGAVNLVPLLPFDGGHIAIAVFEKIRNMIRVGARHGGRGAGQLPQVDARDIRSLGSGGRLHAADRDRRLGQPDQALPVGDYQMTVGLGMPAPPRPRWRRGARPAS